MLPTDGKEILRRGCLVAWRIARIHSDQTTKVSHDLRLDCHRLRLYHTVHSLSLAGNLISLSIFPELPPRLQKFSPYRCLIDPNRCRTNGRSIRCTSQSSKRQSLRWRHPEQMECRRLDWLDALRPLADGGDDRCHIADDHRLIGDGLRILSKFSGCFHPLARFCCHHEI